MRKGNHYRNRLKLPLLIRLVFLVLLAGIFGGSFAVIRNSHIKTGDTIRAEEQVIADLNKESEMWELRITALMDRTDLARRLRWVDSDLQNIVQKQVVTVMVASEGERLISSPTQVAAR